MYALVVQENNVTMLVVGTFFTKSGAEGYIKVLDKILKLGITVEVVPILTKES